MAGKTRQTARSAIFRIVGCLAIAGVLAVALVMTSASVGHASGKGRESNALLWSALDGKVRCGLANLAAPGQDRLLCFASSIPAPKNADPSIGDPGFVYLKAVGGAKLARISQYSWEKGKNYGESQSATPLRIGDRWKRRGLAVTCGIKERAVRCRNEAGHGFIIRGDSYRAF